MPTRPVCEECGAGPFASVSKKAAHRSKGCKGRPTTGSGTLGTPDTKVSLEGTLTPVSRENSNDSADMDRDTSVGTPGHSHTTHSSLESNSRDTGVPDSVPFPGSLQVDDPRDKDKNAVAYLSDKTQHMNDNERRFFYQMRFSILGDGSGNGGTNHITPAQREYLYSIRAMVEGMEEEETASERLMRRGRHWQDVQKPDHDTVNCEQCILARTMKAEEDAETLREDAEIKADFLRREALAAKESEAGRNPLPTQRPPMTTREAMARSGARQAILKRLAAAKEKRNGK